MALSTQSQGIRNIVLYVSLAVAVLWAVARTGPQKLFHVDFDLQRARAWPSNSVPTLEEYTQDSAISPLLVQLLNIETVNGYLALHFLAVLSAVVLLFISIGRMTTSTGVLRIQAMRILVLSPVTYLLLKTIGSYDPFTVIAIALMMMAWISSKRTLMTIAGIFAGVQHFEQTFVGVSLILALHLLIPQALPLRLRCARNPAWLLLGVLLGKVVLEIYLALSQVTAGSGRFLWVSDFELLRLSVSGSLNFLPVLMLSFFAGTWGVMALYGVNIFSRRLAIPIAGLLAVPAVISVLAFDHTRVFVLMTLPLVLVAIAYLSENCGSELQKRSLNAAEVLAWVITPLLLFTSPDGPTFIFDPNILDHWFMTLSQLGNGGWS